MPFAFADCRFRRRHAAFRFIMPPLFFSAAAIAALMPLLLFFASAFFRHAAGCHY